MKEAWTFNKSEYLMLKDNSYNNLVNLEKKLHYKKISKFFKYEYSG